MDKKDLIAIMAAILYGTRYKEVLEDDAAKYAVADAEMLLDLAEERVAKS